MTKLVLLPGLDGTGTLFQPFLRELPAGWRTVVVSYPMDANAGYDALTLHAALALPDGEPLVLLGESFSGPIAVRLATMLGARVQALVLCCTFVRNPRPRAAWLRGLVRWLPGPAVLPSALSGRVLLGPRAAAQAHRLLSVALKRLPKALLHARLRMVMSVDVSADLATLTVPVLYLQAAQDWVVPASAVEHVRSSCTQVMVVRLAGPHGLLQAEPKAAAAAMTSFLARLA